MTPAHAHAQACMTLALTLALQLIVTSALNLALILAQILTLALTLILAQSRIRALYIASPWSLVSGANASPDQLSSVYIWNIVSVDLTFGTR